MSTQKNADKWGMTFMGALLAIAVLGLSLSACSGNPEPPMGPSGTPVVTPQPSPTPVVVTAGISSFDPPTAISVVSGGQVYFNLGSSHTVTIDDGAGSATCARRFIGTDFPVLVPFTGSSGAVYNIHCEFHTGCGATTCTGCSGMTMTVTIL